MGVKSSSPHILSKTNRQTETKQKTKIALAEGFQGSRKQILTKGGVVGSLQITPAGVHDPQEHP